MRYHPHGLRGVPPHIHITEHNMLCCNQHTGFIGAACAEHLLLCAVDTVVGALTEGDTAHDFLGPVQPDAIMQQVAEGTDSKHVFTAQAPTQHMGGPAVKLAVTYRAYRGLEMADNACHRACSTLHGPLVHEECSLAQVRPCCHAQILVQNASTCRIM